MNTENSNLGNYLYVEKKLFVIDSYFVVIQNSKNISVDT